jgi:polyketide synthase PksN
LIQIEQDNKPEDKVKILKKEYKNIKDIHIRYISGKRYAMSMREIAIDKGQRVIPWKDGGIYLITGGMGGLGIIFAREIAARAKDAVLVLTGRSPLNGEKDAKLKEIEHLGAKVLYRQVDVADRKRWMA